LIHGFYILCEDLGCMFEYTANEYEIGKSKHIDPVLLTGFISAMINFSSEAFSETLQTINLKTNIMVISNIKSQMGLFISVAIADFYDNPYLIQDISLSILRKFYEKFYPRMYRVGREEINREFKEIVESTIFKRVKKRSISVLILGALGIIGTYFIASYLYYNPFNGALSILAFPIGLLLSTLCGYYIGSAKTASITFTLLIAILNQPFRFMIDYMSSYGYATFVAFPEVYLVLSLALGFIGGILGGSLADRKYLYPSNYEEPYTKIYLKIRNAFK